MASDEEVQRHMFGLVYRHFVSLRRVEVIPGIPGTPIGGFVVPKRYSGSVACIRGEWFLITAGHVIEGLAGLAERGYLLEQWALDVRGNPASQDADFIPFDLVDAAKHARYDKAKGDFGCIHLREEYRVKLQAAGIVPITEQAWRAPAEAEAYWLLGIPDELVEIRGSGAEAEERTLFSVIGVERLVNLPSHIQGGAFFYAKLPDKSLLVSDGRELDNIVGVSGGPIFALKTNPFRYWCVAIQSAWYRQDRIILGYPYGAYAEWIGHALDSGKITLS